MIRLYNHTRHPDGPIRDALTFAARAIGVKGDVVVKVTSCRHARGRASASREFPYLGFLRGTKNRDGINDRLMGDLPGWVEMALPDRMRKGEAYGKMYIRTYGSSDWLDSCWWFVKTALHEMAHILQYRENRYASLRTREASGPKRRMAYDRRPCEIDADNRMNDVLDDRRKRARAQDLAIDLAIAIEESLKGR